MKKLTLTAALFAMGAFAESWTGTVSDAKCKHTDASAKSIECTKRCVDRGEAAVFVSGDKVLKIADASKEMYMPLLGQKVVVTGDVKDDTLTITSIKAAE